jgi:hypothetical protein
MGDLQYLRMNFVLFGETLWAMFKIASFGKLRRLLLEDMCELNIATVAAMVFAFPRFVLAHLFWPRPHLLCS